MGLLRVEFLASYLSDQLVNGFCTGAAVHVVVVQVNKLVQVDVTKFSGPGYLIKHLMDLFAKVTTTNMTAMIISICGFVFLYLGKDVLGSKLRKHLPAPIPFELLLVVISTGVSAIWNFESAKSINVVKEVPVGLPVAKIPRIELIPYVIGPAFEIAFVVVALHLSMCKVFNRKLGSKTDNNQELYAMGIMASLSSFFNTYPISSSLGRSMLNVECGAKTQLSSLFTAALLLIVILFLGPLLSTLPMCILAMIWIVTFVATVILNVMSGLAVAVVFALLTTIFRIQWPRWRMLSQLTGTEEYRDIGRYGRTTEVEGIKIFRFDAPLLFTNVEHFSNSIDRALSEYENPGKANNFVLSPAPKQTRQLKNKSLVARIFATKDDYDKHYSRNNGVEHFVVDCSGFTFIDFTSVSALIDIFKRLQRRGISVYFAEAKAPMRDTLEACGFYNTVPKCNFYPTIHDAVLAACEQKRSRTLSAAIESPRNEKHFFIEDGLGIPTSPIRIESKQNLESLQIGSLDGWESSRRLDVQDDL
uniref:STAS domain-containing protein n=1 Tax=Panagrolaimus sp. JU765 TaxID=591449 RepID=A0AC34QID1_9BILA